MRVEDTSTPHNFNIVVNPVNDAPSFTKGADQTTSEDSGPQSVSGWATAISPGPADESGQTVNFIVSNNNSGLFSAQPAVSSTPGPRSPTCFPSTQLAATSTTAEPGLIISRVMRPTLPAAATRMSALRT